MSRNSVEVIVSPGRSVKIRLRDLVYDQCDQRHAGHVEAITNTSYVIVRWLETGWLSELPSRDIRKVLVAGQWPMKIAIDYENPGFSLPRGVVGWKRV